MGIHELSFLEELMNLDKLEFTHSDLFERSGTPRQARGNFSLRSKLQLRVSRGI